MVQPQVLMEVLRFEIWRASTLVDVTEYEAPLTREEALDALNAENPLWIGKLTVKGSKVGLRGRARWTLRRPMSCGLQIRQVEAHARCRVVSL